MSQTLLGGYGDWASRSVPDPPRLSLRHGRPESLASWRQTARERLAELLLEPAGAAVPVATVLDQYVLDGLHIEHLEWRLAYGPPTQAVLVKPADARARLPGILALHDHAGDKFFGWEKVAGTATEPVPAMAAHHRRFYGGRPWAGELARRGFVVLAHDVFAFGSRRMRPADLPDGLSERVGASLPGEDDIGGYNQLARGLEPVVAKSLFSAGLTWPGVAVFEDRRALDYLASRPDVDGGRLGSAGMSGGGLRTVLLAAVDERIRCSCCVAMMTTWRDLSLAKAADHTWMCYVPGLPRELDFPELLGLSVPNPVLVLNNRDDRLFTPSEVERADRILAEVYRTTGAPDRYRATFHDGAHKFDREMQAEAFDWFEAWLKR